MSETGGARAATDAESASREESKQVGLIDAVGAKEIQLAAFIVDSREPRGVWEVPKPPLNCCLNSATSMKQPGVASPTNRIYSIPNQSHQNPLSDESFSIPGPLGEGLENPLRTRSSGQRTLMDAYPSRLTDDLVAVAHVLGTTS